LLDRGCSQKEVARTLGKSEGAISYELSENSRKGKPYDPEYAHLRAYQKRWHSKYQGKKIVSDSELRKTVEEYLLDDQSPELISERIERYHKDIPSVSPSVIRKYIASPYGRKIEAHREKLSKRYARRGGRKTSMEGKRMIGKRPRYINTRKRIGDAEGDFILSGRSGKGMLMNITDRKSRAPFLEKIYPVSIPNMERALGRIKKRFPEVRTLTLDNDLLFIHHKRLEERFGIRIYFCHKGSPWEKGSNENRNKIIRKYIPKRTDISKVSRYMISKLEAKLQGRFMKCLKAKSPKEVLEAHRKRKKKR